ncbi:MAG: ABC transporter permease [Chitinophagaceae bacterium]
MFRNYLKLAYRNLVRHKGFSIINVVGLAIGIAACLILFLVVRYENSYDTFQPDYQRIYRVVTTDKTPDDEAHTPGIPFPALESLRADLPDVKTGALLSSYGSQITIPNSGTNGAPDNRFIEDYGVFYCDPQFFEVFHFKWLAGDGKVLAEPNTVVLSEEKAKKYFGSWQDAVGKSLMIDNAITLKVGGVLENMPDNSDFPMYVVASFETAKQNAVVTNYTTDWGSTTSNFQLYMLLPQNTTQAGIDGQLKKLSDRYYRNANSVNKRWNSLQPLADIHFDTRYGSLGDHITQRSTLLTLSLIGLLIIVMACINFINLSTAQAVGRSREIGVRKVLGGNRLQLFGQMMGETALLVILASMLAVVIAIIALPYVKYVIAVNGTLSLLNIPALLFIAALIVVVTILSGLYPSLIVSGFKPALALKNKITSASVGGISLRRVLVVTQFAISQMLIIGTIVAVSQMNFIRNADLGFNKDAIFILQANADSTFRASLQSFKEDLLQQPGIQAVTFSSDVPSSDNNWASNFAYDGRQDENFAMFMKFGDEDYIKTYGLKLLAGRNYLRSDTANEVLLNETALKKLGVKNPQDAIGKTLRLGRGPWRPIVGIVSDFKTNSLRDEIKPLLIVPNKRRYSVASVKLHTASLAGSVATIQKTWDKYFPRYANASRFMDESIEQFYRQESQLSLMYKIFAGLAIFISCLGLYGLVSFMAVQKTKEVGIRKVLGASIANILYLFSKEFTVLIGIAFIIAAPAAYFLMNNWLGNFVFRISIGLGVFLIALVSSLIIAWITVGYKAARAAMVNPVKSLRSE